MPTRTRAWHARGWRRGRGSVPEGEGSGAWEGGQSPEFSGLNEETDPGAQRTDLGAEGRGLEPPTGFPAPDFESGRWPIRLPSELVDFQFIRPLKVGQ
jgi:hypothetical protein